MTWWDSFDTLSKLQTALAILVSILGFATLAIKLRADHVKKRTDARRLEERLNLDKELENKTAEALRATAELEARQAPRRLTELQIAAIQRAMATFPTRPHFVLWYRQPDREAEEYADLLARTLQSVGFKDGEMPGMWGVRIPAGLTINTSHPDSKLRAALASALKAAGVPFTEQPLNNDPTPILGIGPKP